MPDSVVAAEGNVVSSQGGAKLFGSNFPGRSNDGKKWRLWINDRIKEQEPVMRDKRLHWARHRHFAAGRQWISTRDGRVFREIEGDGNTIRAVLDQIGPALDFRLSIMSEQRPGFRTHPLGTGTNARETAEAQQMVAEHYFNRLNGMKLLRDAKINAYTDGVAFLHVFVDPNAGPTREDVELIPPTDERYEMMKAQGYKEEDGVLKVPLNDVGNHAPVGQEVEEFAMGDLATRIVLAHEVYADPEAKTMNGPYDRAKWVVIRRVRDIMAARIETGKKGLKSDATSQAMDPVMDAVDISGTPATSTGFQRGLPPYPATRARGRGTTDQVFEFLVYIAPAPEAGIKHGIWRRIIGDTVVNGADELPGGKIPLARMTDGSTDPQFFPRPVMSLWISDQISINALWSKLLEHVRIFGTGRLMTQKGTLLTETYTNVVASVLEYVGAKPEYLPGTRASSDTWKQLETAIKMLQDKTGWNDMARGQVTGSGTLSDVSGRALLGAKEIFERNFGNDIRAAGEAMSEWAVLIVDYARWLFDEPRLIPILGRGDLAKKIEAQDLGEDTVVYMDAETLSPTPKSLRLQQLTDLVDRGWITLEEFKRRSPMAEIRNVMMGDQPQWERAQWVNTFFEEKWQELAGVQFIERFSPGMGVPVWWQDNPEIHKRALEEIIDDERKPLPLRDIAAERWGIYDQLLLSKPQETEQGMVPGQPLGPPALMVVRGTPVHLTGQPTQIAQPAGAGPPAGAPGVAPQGEGQALGAPTSGPAPEISGVPGQPAAAPALGNFGAVEQAAVQQQ